MLTPGVYLDVPDPEYRSWPAISQTSLKVIGEKSPAAYKYQQEHLRPRTEALIRGSVVDCLCFEPEAWDERFLVSKWPNAICLECGADPCEPCTTQKGSPAKVCHSGRKAAPSFDKRIVITPEESKEYGRIASAALEHPTVGNLIATSQHQVSLLWKDEETEVMCKGRLDIKRDDLIGDLKTCMAGAARNPGAWARHAFKFGYHYQSAFYTGGWEVLTGERLPWLWAAVETEAPYPVAIFQADPNWMRAGEIAYRRALRMYADCLEVNAWPGYPDDVQECSLPSWAMRAVEEME